jgi:hypothetical protein
MVLDTDEGAGIKGCRCVVYVTRGGEAAKHRASSSCHWNMILVVAADSHCRLTETCGMVEARHWSLRHDNADLWAPTMDGTRDEIKQATSQSPSEYRRSQGRGVGKGANGLLAYHEMGGGRWLGNGAQRVKLCASTDITSRPLGVDGY